LALALLAFPLVRWLIMLSPAPLQALFPGAWFQGTTLGLVRVTANAAACVLLLVLAPWLTVRALEARTGWATATTSMLGLGGARPLAFWRITAAAAALAGALALMSRLLLPSLCAAYPLYRGACAAPWPATLLAETMYLGVILSTEFFYRGVLLTALRASTPRAALPVMALACGLDHLGAPLPELATSVAGAWLLGWMALRTRSIWPGAAAHATLALGVDAACCVFR
jgi:membrane protease YdiL (CAAX protease family)